MNGLQVASGDCFQQQKVELLEGHLESLVLLQLLGAGLV